MKKIKLVIDSYLESGKIVRDLGLRWGYFIGGLVGIIILTLFYFLSTHIGDWIFLKISQIFKVQEYGMIIKAIVMFIIRVIIVGIYYLFFKSVLLTILAPFFSFVSEKIEEKLYNKSYNFGMKENIGFVIRGVKISLKSLGKELFFTALVLLLSFIPLVNFLVPILIFLIQSYFISFTFVDYTLERRGYSADETLKLMRKNSFPFTLGGGIFTVMYFIPVVGIFMAPLTAITAFTLITLKVLEEEA